MMSFSCYTKTGHSAGSVSIKPHFVKQLIKAGIGHFMIGDNIVFREDNEAWPIEVCKLTSEIREGILGVLRVFLAALVAESIGEIKTAVLTGKPIDEMYEFFVWQVEACLKIAAHIADRNVTHFDIS